MPGERGRNVGIAPKVGHSKPYQQQYNQYASTDYHPYISILFFLVAHNLYIFLSTLQLFNNRVRGWFATIQKYPLTYIKFHKKRPPIMADYEILLNFVD